MVAYSTPQVTNPLRILLIEDDEGDRDLALEYLKGDRNSLYEVTWASSLEAGLAQLKHAHFDAIILDLILPDSRGVTTVSKLWAHSQGIPVIVSSYFDENALAGKVIELGAQDYLAKDTMDSQTIGRTLSRALARARHQATQLSRQRSENTSGVAAGDTAIESGDTSASGSGNGSPTQPDPLAKKLQQLQTDIDRLEAVANDVSQLTHDKQAIDQVRQRMVQTLSHECRSPATAILLATNILKSYAPKTDDEQYLTTLTRIDDAIRQMMQLLDSAMKFKNAQSLAQKAKPERFDLQMLSKKILFQLSNKFTPAPQFTTEYIGECTQVHLYKAVAEQVLVQLLTNAAQYSRADLPIHLTLKKAAGVVTVEVKDRGYGIPADEQSRVFEAFYRTSNYTDHSHNVHGIGLGLTLVKSCVEMCHGTISLTSQLNKGTTVTVVIPELS